MKFGQFAGAGAQLSRGESCLESLVLWGLLHLLAPLSPSASHTSVAKF
jgi:hypothetical protein